MQPIRFPSNEAVGQQSPDQRLQQLTQVDLVLLVNDALVAINEGRWESLRELLGRIIEITNSQPLLKKQFAEIEGLVTMLPDQFAEEKIILICLIADYLSSRPLIHRLGRDGLGQPVRWECDLLLSMQWLQTAMDLSKKIGKTNVLNLLYNRTDRLFARFVVFEVIEDKVWMGVIKAAGNRIHCNCWRNDYKILDYIGNLKNYCHSDDFSVVIHRLLKYVMRKIPKRSSVAQKILPYRTEATAIGQAPVDEGDRIQIVKSCQENTIVFRKDLAMIANEDDLSVRAKQLVIFNRYRHYFQETFVLHLQALLGPPPSPCRYHVVAMGSVGRKEITPLADLECFILMEEKKLTEEEKNRDNRRTLEEIYCQENEENRRYFKKMGRLLELLVLSVGEWFSTTIPPLSLQGKSLMKGFHIDPTKGIEEEPWESNVLVATIDEAKALILKKGCSSYPEEEFAKYGNDKGGNCYSLIKSASLYSFDSSEDLFQDYQREIEQLLRSPLSSGEGVKNCGEKIIRYTLQKRCREFSRYRGNVLHGTVDLKEIIFQPFNLLLTDLHTFLCGSEDSTATPAKTNTFDLIDELAPLFTSDGIELLKILAKELHSLRISLHTYYGVESGAIKDEASFDGTSLTHYTLTSQQQRMIRIAHQLVLKPLYAKIEEIISRGYALSPIDLMHEGVENILQLFEQGKHDELNHRFRLWMTLPISQQLSFYHALSAVGADEHLREIFIDGIEKMLPKEQLEIFLQEPHSMTGYRQKERIARRDLQQAILAISTTEKETPYLILAPFIHEPRYLKRTVTEQVIDRGDLKAEPKYAAVSGNRVCSLIHEKVNLHLKQAPADGNGSPFFPGKEQGVNRLMMRLFGRGCSFSELVYLTNTSTQRGYFVLISQTVFGANLNDIIEDSSALAQVDCSQLTELFLSIPLILPGDHRPVNFMVESTTDAAEQTSSQLICVDNDVAWVRPIQAKKNLLGQINYTINIYAPLFFLFPNFNLEEEAIKEFLLLRPTSLIKAWFEEMIALNASYEQTFRRYLPSVICPYFILEKGMGGQLFVQFCHLQSYLQKHFNRPIQAEELFNTFISYEAGQSVDVGKMLFDKYTAEKNAAGSISDKVKRITGRDSTKSLSLSQSTKVMFNHLDLNANILRPDQSIKELNFLSLYIDKIRIIQQENDLYKVEKGFSEVVRPDGSPDLATQEALIDTIAAITCDKLDLSHCPALTDVALIRILKKSEHHLTYLNLRRCPLITNQSISLLATYCPHLKELYLSGCPRITSLSNNNLVGLKTRAYLLFLRILHISHCNQLTVIDLRSYALMTVKADNNPNLTKVNLDALETPDTHFAHCPKLKQEWSSKLANRIARYERQHGAKICYVLNRLYRNDSSFTKLNLYNKASPANIAFLILGLQHNSSLTKLKLEHNYIGADDATSLAEALQHNSSLTMLSWSHNNIGAAGIASLSEALQHNSSLTRLSLFYNKIGTGGTVSLAKALQHNNSLTELNLKYNNIGADGAASLSEALQHNSSITELHLDNNNIGNTGATSLAGALQHNSSLKTLNCAYNNIDRDGAASLIKALQYNNSLTMLNLRGSFRATDVAFLAEALKHNKSLTTLDLGRNEIDSASITSLFLGLQRNSSLKTLNLQYNNIGVDGAASLALGLRRRHNNSLTTLHLENNYIDAIGAAYLAKVLKHNKSLTTLHLTSNRIGARGAVSFAEALQRNSSLTTLNLEDNDIGADGTSSLSEALQHNSSLTTLDLTNNHFGAAGAASLAQALQHNNSLIKLDLGHNYIRATGAISFAEALQCNSSLTTLNLKGNDIGTDGTSALAEALQHNSSLTTLDLTSNHFGVAGAVSFAKTLQHNSSLKTLILQSNSIAAADGVASLAQALQHNNSLIKLDLGYNYIRDTGATSFAEALQCNSSLTTLNLKGNGIGVDGTSSLSEALQHNSSLTNLHLGNIGIFTVKMRIKAALKRNKRLKEEEDLKACSLPDVVLEMNTSAIGVQTEKKLLSSSSNDHSTLTFNQEKKSLSSLSPYLSDSSSHKVGTGLENALNNCFFNAMMQLIMNSSLKDFFLNGRHLIVPSKTTTQDQIDRVFAFFSDIGETYAKASQTVGNIVRYDSSEMREILGLGSDGQEDAFQAFNALCHFYNLTTLSIPLSFTTKVDLTTKIRLEAIPDDPIEIGDDGLSSSPRVEQFLTHPVALKKIPTTMQKLVEETFSREEICDQLIRFIHRGIPYSVNQFTRQLHFDPQNLKDELLFHVLRFNKQFEKVMTLLPEDLFEVRFGSDTNAVNYSLIGFIVHTGTTLESGHYIAYIKSARGWTQWSDATGQFFNDDTSRQAASASSAASSSSSSLPSGTVPHSKIVAAAREAYILHYKKSLSENNEN